VTFYLFVTDDDYESQNYMEPLIKLTYYASISSYFSTSERNSLRNLTDRLASEFDDTDKWQFKAMCQYLDYMDAIDNGTNVFNWVSSDLNYESDLITNRVVSGDFDNDGYEDDIAAFADYGNNTAKIHVWESNGKSFEYRWDWNIEGYDVNKITGRVVSGNFDNDAYNDDIAAFYDYGNGNVKMHVWRSNGTTFTYSWEWVETGYDCNMTTNRVVSGDFDNDGKKDDIAAFYDYGGQSVKLNLWEFNGTSFNYRWDWQANGYNANKISGRVVSGDFDNDNYHDDIMALYDYGEAGAKMHEWNFNGLSFDYSWAWSTAGYNANKVTSRFVSGDFDGDNKLDDISAFYDYGTAGVKQHIWNSNGFNLNYGWSWVASNYNSNMITGRVVSGNFNQDCFYDDMSAFYDYGINNTRIHVWLNNIYQGPSS
jgi:hypothetical protein